MDWSLSFVISGDLISMMNTKSYKNIPIMEGSRLWLLRLSGRNDLPQSAVWGVVGCRNGSLLETQTAARIVGISSWSSLILHLLLTCCLHGHSCNLHHWLVYPVYPHVCTYHLARNGLGHKPGKYVPMVLGTRPYYVLLTCWGIKKKNNKLLP